MYQPIKTTFLSLLLSCSFLTGCDMLNEKHGNTPSQAIKVGMSHCCVPTDSFMFNVANMIRNESKQSQSQIAFHNAGGSQEQQLADINKLISQKPDVIMVSRVIDNDPLDLYGKKLVDTFKNTGIPVVFYILGAKTPDTYTNTAAYYVGSNPPQAGILQAEMIMKHLERNPQWDRNGDGIIQYVLLKGPVGNPDAEARTKWVSSTLAGYPTRNIKIEQLDLKVCNWQRLEAKEQMTAWLDSDLANSIELVISNNDDMALGAIEAMQEKNIPMLPVYGVDALPEALNNINQGYMQGTILQDSVGQAKSAWQLAYNLGTHQDPNQGFKKHIIQNQVLVPYIPIDQENVGAFLK